jgi:hypothetical protein
MGCCANDDDYFYYYYELTVLRPREEAGLAMYIELQMIGC